MIVRDLPFMQLFTKDWLSCEKLRLCSLAARGLWFELTCHMHQNARRRGYLDTANGDPVTVEQIARLVAIPTAEAAELIRELEESGALARDENGVIYSRRILKDEKKREQQSAAGKASAKNRRVRGDGGRFGGSSTERAPNGRPNARRTTSGTGDRTANRTTDGTETEPSENREQSKYISAGADEPTEKTPEKTHKPRARNPLFDALADATGSDPALTGSHIGKVAAALANATPPFTPEDVREFAARWRELLPWAKPSEHPRLTLGVIQNHIHTLRAARKAATETPTVRRAADNPMVNPIDYFEEAGR